jgi:hypothetical protein
VINFINLNEIYNQQLGETLFFITGTNQTSFHVEYTDGSYSLLDGRDMCHLWENKKCICKFQKIWKEQTAWEP